MIKQLATLIRYDNTTNPEHRTVILVYSEAYEDTYCETGYQDMDGLNSLCSTQTREDRCPS
uniref:Uncharacterized protein n=1 Tax=viral metagenome TaxID=1070528 RepID=A0A6M3JT86_9ZZZZ